MNDETFTLLFEAWHEAGCPYRLVPSIDRINSTGGYMFGNLRFVTHSDNAKSGSRLYWEQRRATEASLTACEEPGLDEIESSFGLSQEPTSSASSPVNAEWPQDVAHEPRARARPVAEGDPHADEEDRDGQHGRLAVVNHQADLKEDRDTPNDDCSERGPCDALAEDASGVEGDPRPGQGISASQETRERLAA